MTEIKKNPIPEDKSKDAKAAELTDEALEQVAGGGTITPTSKVHGPEQEQTEELP